MIMKNEKDDDTVKKLFDKFMKEVNSKALMEGLNKTEKTEMIKQFIAKFKRSEKIDDLLDEN